MRAKGPISYLFSLPYTLFSAHMQTLNQVNVGVFCVFEENSCGVDGR